jgi:ketosteroid isomerase-like protein
LNDVAHLSRIFGESQMPACDTARNPSFWEDVLTAMPQSLSEAAAMGSSDEYSTSAILETLERHSRAERSADIDGVMETVTPDPVWEFFGRRYAGRDAVRHFYESFINHLQDMAPLDYRTVVVGNNVVAAEFSWVIHTPDGDRSYPASCMMEIRDGLVQAERVYCGDLELATLVFEWLDE